MQICNKLIQQVHSLVVDIFITIILQTVQNIQFQYQSTYSDREAANAVAFRFWKWSLWHKQVK
jgi:hypothetical protein